MLFYSFKNSLRVKCFRFKLQKFIKMIFLIKDEYEKSYCYIVFV